MSEFLDSANTSTTGTPRWVGLAVGLLGGISLLGLGVGWSALNQAKSIEQTTQASFKQSAFSSSRTMLGRNNKTDSEATWAKVSG